MSHLGYEIKKLGFGLMRLPKRGDNIDVEQVKVMVDRFLADGFTYFDTAWAYPGSEDAIRQALVERHPREAFQLATKNAAWIKCKSREEAIGQFETSLRQTGAGYFDFYLLHNLGESRTRFFDVFNMWDFVQEKKRQGLIRHVGFSFHSTPEELEQILSAHPEMEFVQLQINYGDWENPAVQSRACYEVARRHEKPVIIMEPVKGGLEGVITVLSGMSNLKQMEDNLSYMRNFAPLSAEEHTTIQEAQKALNSIPLIPCTTCNYCAKVCPNDIGISGSFIAMNYLTLYKDKRAARVQEQWLVGGHGRQSADKCVQCGVCEAVCPQHIAIRDELVRVHAALGDGQLAPGS